MRKDGVESHCGYIHLTHTVGETEPKLEPDAERLPSKRAEMSRSTNTQTSIEDAQ